MTFYVHSQWRRRISFAGGLYCARQFVASSERLIKNWACLKLLVGAYLILIQKRDSVIYIGQKSSTGLSTGAVLLIAKMASFCHLINPVPL